MVVSRGRRMSFADNHKWDVKIFLGAFESNPLNLSLVGLLVTPRNSSWWGIPHRGGETRLATIPEVKLLYNR